MAVFIRPVPGTHPSGARQNRALVKNRSRRFFRRQSLALRVTVANSKSNQKCRALLTQPCGSLRAIVYKNMEALLPSGARANARPCAEALFAPSMALSTPDSSNF